MDLVQWGAPLIEWLQDQAWLHAPAEVFTFIGDVRFMIVWIPIVAWTWRRQVGLELLLMMSLYGATNSAWKMLAQSPRPYWVVESVQPLASEGSFGLPSGHAAFAMVVWGALFLGVSNRWVRTLCVVMILGIGASRVVLGVHWPADVLTGWVLGAVLVGARRAAARRAIKLESTGRVPGGTGVAWRPLVFGPSLLALTALIAATVDPVPPEWIALGSRGEELLEPTSLLGAAVLCGGLSGVLLGIGTAGLIDPRTRRLERLDLGPTAAALRVLVGLVVVVLLAGGLGSLVSGDGPAAVAGAFLLGGTVTWWIADGSERAFARLGLEPRTESHR